jgi:hypothetical protein
MAGVDDRTSAVDAARKIQTAARRPIECRAALRIVSAFRSTLIPAGRRARKEKAVIRAAHADYKSGMRGVALYRKHLPRFDRMGYWEREVKTRRLMDAIRSRERRSRARIDRQNLMANFPTLRLPRHARR